MDCDTTVVDAFDLTPVKVQFASIVSAPIENVRAVATCGSLVIVLYLVVSIQAEADAASAAISAQVGDAAAAASVFGLPIINVVSPYATRIPPESESSRALSAAARGALNAAVAVAAVVAVVGKGPTGALPLITAVQRMSLFSKLAIGGSSASTRELGESMRWAMGRFGLHSASSRRRLQSSTSGEAGGRGASRSTEEELEMEVALLDTVYSFATTVGVVFGLQIVMLILWKTLCNRGFYQYEVKQAQKGEAKPRQGCPADAEAVPVEDLV
eukprot:707606-Prymnesium_polylepis.1